MSIDLDMLSSRMERLFHNVIIQEKILSLDDIKNELFNKKELLSKFRTNLLRKDLGKITHKLLSELEHIEVDFKNLYDNFDDRLMIFIIGNGNVGKSMLLNALVGYEVAETNFLPNTWKIDIYTPESDKSKAVLKYTNGKVEKLPIAKVKEIVSKEEKKSKEAKKAYNDNLNEALKNLKTKEEREEMKRYLAEQYIYKSNVSEVRWPVDKNWILEKCLLVDTPGLNQNLHDLHQLGNIHDYYHKADGVLWLLDGQTIAAANANTVFAELDEVLKTVGGVRDNIIGVVNRMDLVRKNGGEAAAAKVINDAKRIFGNKFSKIVDISAHQAFEGVKNKKPSDIDTSGILNLQNTIRDIFISKSESVKNSAKIQGHNKLMDLVTKELEQFSSQVEEYEEVYWEKEEKLESLVEQFVENLEEEIESFFGSYLKEVAQRVETYINSLSEGQGSSFVKNTMYKLDDFIESRDKFIDNKLLEIKNSTLTWEKLCKISEYKYIQNFALVEKKNVLVKVNLDLNSLDNIGYFSPAVEDNLFSFLGNVFGKAMFWLRKGSIKSEINAAIKQECDKMKEEMIELLKSNVEESADSCFDIIDTTFRNILFDIELTDTIKEEISELQTRLNEEKGNIKLIDIIK